MSLPDWREVARESQARLRRFVETFNRIERENREYARKLLEERMGIEDAIIAAPHLFGHAQANGGSKSGASRNQRNERLVLERISQMKPLPPPRNLVRALTDAGMGRNPASAALKRLALKGELPDVYRDYFSRARSRSDCSAEQSREAGCFLG